MSKLVGLSQWQAMTLSIMAGMGFGYLVGMFVTRRWLQRVGGSDTDNTRSSPTDAELREALVELKSEVEQLRSSMEQAMTRLETSQQTARNFSSRALTDPATSEFVSAQGDEEDRFFDLDDEEEDTESMQAAQVQLDFQRLDEMGKNTYTDESACHTLLEELDGLLVECQNEPELLWRKSRVLCHLGSLNDSDKDKKMEFTDQAVEVAKKAVELGAELWQSHYWYALAIGSQVKHQSIQKKIVGGYEYKDHLERAVALKPDEPELHHYLGRWFFEVAGVSWLERKAASALFAKPPEATYNEAMDAFMKAEDLTPETHKANLLMIAKCHMKLGDHPSAVQWLEKASKLESLNREDESSHVEIEELLLQLSSV